MGVKQLVVAAFIFVLIQLWCCNGYWEDERLGLLQLQSSFNISTDPFENTTNYCDWSRTKCDAHTGRVTSLDLTNARDWNLGEWYLNAFLFIPFKQLTYLYLSNNRITGCLHNEGFERLAKLSELKYVYLDGNNFNNSILPSLSGISFLNLLDIGYNNLKGSINLGELASLKNLETLLLGGNKNITEFVVSKDVKAPPNLNTIYLDNVTANGMSLLLKSLTRISSLKTLSLQFNNLTKSNFRHESQSFKSLENLCLDGSVVDDNFFRSLYMFSLKSLSFWVGNGLNLQGLCNLNPNHLQALDLSHNNLNGRLPLCLSNFTSLQYLDLSYNSLEGNLHSTSIGRLTNLQSLDLSGNNFSGTLPLCLSNVTSLQDLDLSYNSLEGNLHSTSIGRLTNLQSLDLSGNNFSGTLPWWLANLTSLQQLYLSYNSLAGNLSSSPPTVITSVQDLSFDYNKFQIPISLVPFYNYSNLSYLGVNGNELYAETERHSLIPKFQLKDIDMSCNGCGGSFPRFLYNQRNLQIVYLRDNKMSGEFPHWLLENNTRLEYLVLSNNSLTGTIRLPTHSHMNLLSLDISSNCFSGHIPTKFGTYFPNLEYLDMSHNELSGSVPSSIGNLSTMEYLDMSHNELNGSIPPSVGNLSLLQVLVFNNNHFSGEIPSWLGSREFLRILDISWNNLSGNIPRFVGASSLTEVYMSNNMIHGSFLRSFSDCSQLTTLDLSHNFLTEDLSRWNGGFPILGFLLLGHNMLEGEISSKMCSLPKLSYVDLSNNNISGPILSCLMYYSNWYRGHGEHSHPPDYFVQGSTSAIAPSYADAPLAQPQQPIEITTKNISLSYKGMILSLYSGIDLSCNNLSGQIPPEFGNLNQIKTLNLSHNRLIGLIPTTFSNLDQIESLDLSYNKLQGNIPPQLTRLPFVSSFSVAHNNLSGRTPQRIKQFATFNNDSYEGNPFLCGEPLSKNCSPKPPSAMSTTTSSNEEESGFIDMRIFYVTFVVTYTIVLSGITAILYINPYWRRAWFYFLERKMEDCYYFAMYDCPRFFKFKA